MKRTFILISIMTVLLVGSNLFAQQGGGTSYLTHKTIIQKNIK